MRHISVDWHHEFEDEPIHLYSEIQGSDELRKVEVFRTGHMDYAGPGGNTGSTILGREVPSIEAINSQPEFRASAITAPEFEEIWLQAVRTHHG